MRSRSGDDRDCEEWLPAHRWMLPVHERYPPRAASRVGDAQVDVGRAGQVRVEPERLVAEVRLPNPSVVSRVQRVPDLRHPPPSPDPRTAAKGSADRDCQQAPQACPRLGGSRDGASDADCQTGNQTDRGLGADVAGEDGLGVGVDAGERSRSRSVTVMSAVGAGGDVIGTPGFSASRGPRGRHDCAGWSRDDPRRPRWPRDVGTGIGSVQRSQSPNSSKVWVTSRNPRVTPSSSAHSSTGSATISRARPQARQTR